MSKKVLRTFVLFSVFTLLFSQLFIGQAYASWGAAKLAEITGRKVIPAQTNDVTPTPTSTPTPTPEPEPTPTPAPDSEPTPVSSGDLTSEEEIMLQLVNEERSKNGLKPLILMPELTELARLKSQDIIDKNYFSHTSPTYGSFANMVYNAGIRFYSVGENLAKARNATHAFYLFMASQGHKANILNPNFTHWGVGIKQDKYGVVVTQLFIMK